MRSLYRQINELGRKLHLVVARGRIHRTDGESRAQASFLADEVKDQVDIVQHYGFASRPLPHCECVAICSGSRSSSVVVGTKDRRYHPSLKQGEVALFTDEGIGFQLMRGNHVRIPAKTFEVVGDGGELIQLLIDLVGALEKSTVSTSNGPMPLSAASSLTELGTRLSRFRRG